MERTGELFLILTIKIFLFKFSGIDAQKQHLLNKLVSATGASRVLLPTMSAARCSTGAVFLEGNILVCGTL